MKFLSKTPESQILKDNLKYSRNASENRKLKNALLSEQRGFCAYSEKYIEGIDSIDIEHFNASLKFTDEDGYYNYYAVLHSRNISKRDDAFKNAKFHETLFFQNREEFESRIFICDMLYFAKNPEDTESSDFIDFLGLNSNSLYDDRKTKVKFLKNMREILSEEEFMELFNYKINLSFISIVENELGLSLEEYI